MSYIGRQRPTETTSSVLRSTYTGNGSTTTYALPGPVANETSIIATINGVTQQDSAYTTDGSNIIFAAAPALNDAIELRTISAVGLSYAPFAGSVTTGILADDAVTTGKIVAGAVTSGKLASGAAVANIGTRAIGVSQVPAGSVIQVVQGSVETTTQISTTTTPTDTSITATITPSSASNKILVLYSGQWFPYNSVSWSVLYMSARIVRGATAIKSYDSYAQAINWPSSFGGIYYIPVTMSYLDSPATTSSTTYKIQIYGDAGNNAGAILRTTQGQMILMEVAG